MEAGAIAALNPAALHIYFLMLAVPDAPCSFCNAENGPQLPRPIIIINIALLFLCISPVRIYNNSIYLLMVTWLLMTRR